MISWEELSNEERDFFLLFAGVADKSARGYVDESGLSALSQGRFSPSLARALLEGLEEKSFLEGRAQTERVTIGPEFMQNTRERKSFYWIIHPSRVSLVINLRKGNLSKSLIGRSEDENWEPLPLDREDPKYAEVVKRTEELLERVRGDNGLARNDPSRHQAVTWSLNTGLEAIKNNLPSLGQIKQLLLAPTIWIRDTFAKTAMGELAKQAATAIVKWLGLQL